MHVIDKLDTGGAERLLVTIANIFFEHGHPVKVVTIAQPGPLAAQLHTGIQQINLARKFKFNPATMHRLIKETNGFDIVHVHSFHNLRYLWLAKMLYGLNKPIFYHEHFGFRAQMHPTFWQRYILPKTIFISTAANISTWAVTVASVPENRVFTLKNIVIKEQVPQVGKKQTGIIKLVLVSNIRREKNIEFAIRLLKELNKVDTHYHLTIIGKLYQQDYYDSLKRLIDETGTAAHVSFIHNADKVQQLLQQYDIGLHTSPSESGPLAVIEYLAQGLPFLSYNTGETVLQIKGELPECIIQSFDVDEWVSHIDRLLSVPPGTISQKLSSVYTAKFSSKAYYRQCMDIYEKGLRG